VSENCILLTPLSHFKGEVLTIISQGNHNGHTHKKDPVHYPIEQDVTGEMCAFIRFLEGISSFFWRNVRGELKNLSCVLLHPDDHR
jgi:ACT domain-containing protein